MTAAMTLPPLVIDSWRKKIAHRDDDVDKRHHESPWAHNLIQKITMMNPETPTKTNKFRLKHSTCKPCINDECNGTLVIGSKFQGEDEILTIICSNISSHCHPPVTLAKFDYDCKATGFLYIEKYSDSDYVV